MEGESRAPVLAAAEHTIVLVLNTNHQLRKTIVWAAPETKPWRSFMQRARAKLHTKKTPTRLFVLDTGEEMGAGDFTAVLSRHLAASGGKALCVAVSLGEEFGGKGNPNAAAAAAAAAGGDHEGGWFVGGELSQLGATWVEPVSPLDEANEHPNNNSNSQEQGAGEASGAGSERAPQLFKDGRQRDSAGFTPNSTKKQQRTQQRQAKIEHKGNTNKKQRALRDIQTSSLYDSLCQVYHDNRAKAAHVGSKHDAHENAGGNEAGAKQGEEQEGQAKGEGVEVPCPRGLSVTTMGGNVELLQRALGEVDHVCGLILKRLGEIDHRFTNHRFYINTPYFSRTAGADPFPMLRWGDPRVAAICKLVETSLRSFGAIDQPLHSHPDLPLLNVIVRRYCVGDVLGFHTDQPLFTGSIFGLILENHNRSRGLLLHCEGCAPFMVDEESGVCWRLQHAARNHWLHGYCAPQTGEGVVRTSVTFRFFREQRLVPSYDTACDV